MSVTEEVVIEALRPVEDPELHRSIVELEMVRSIVISGTDVTVLIALTVAGCPLKAEITSRVVEALTPIDGIDRVKVDMTTMSEDELARVREVVQSDGGARSHEDAPKPFRFGGERSGTRVLGISSGKGGVGKSSITVNLAVVLAKMGYDVALIDADVYGFSVPAMLGVTDEPRLVAEMIVPPSAHGVRCVSMGFFVDDATPVMWRGPMLHKALNQFLVDVAWGSPDFVLVDMPPGTGDVAMSMSQYLPNTELYVVTTPQLAAQRVAQRSGMMASQLGLRVAGVIENMSWFTGNDGERYELFGAGGGERLAETFGTQLVGRIPLVAALAEGGDNGVPITISQPESEVAFAFEQLAHAVEKAGPRRVYREELRVR